MEDPNLFVSVNGKNFLLPKGKTSNVPSYVAAEIRRAWAAEAKGEENKDELLSKGKEPVYQI
jgi:predicted aconitase with swiveling domain